MTARSTWPRRAARIVAVLAVVELLYVVAANALLSGHWLRDEINRRLAHTTLDWQGASSWIPGYVSGTALVITTDSLRLQSRTEIGSFSGWLSPMGLPSRMLVVHFAHLADISSSVRPASMVRRARDDELPFFPEIPGTEPLLPESPAEAGPFRPGWTVVLPGATTRGAYRLALGNYRFSGRGSIDGALSWRTRERLRIDEGRFLVESIEGSVNDEPLLADARAQGDFQVDDLYPYFHRGLDKLPYISVEGRVSGNLSSLDVLNFYLRTGSREHWDGLVGEGTLGGRLVVDHGRLVPGTDAFIDSDRIVFGAGVMRLAGATRIRVHPQSPADDAPSRLMSVEVEGLELAHRELDGPLALTERLDITVLADDLSIGTPLESFRVEAEIPRGRIPDVSVLNRFIPPSMRVLVEAGSGELAGELAWDDGRMQGGIDVESDDLRVKLRGRPLRGAFAVSLALAADPDLRRVAIGGTHLEIRDAAIDDGESRLEPWQGRIDIEAGHVRLREGALPKERSGAVGEGSERAANRLSTLVDFTDGALRLAGTISDIEFLDYLLSDREQLRFTGPGAFSADLEMAAGTIRPGSEVRFDSDRLAAHFLDFDTRGRGSLAARFGERQSGRHVEVAAAIEDVAVRRDGSSGVFVKAPSVSIDVSGRIPDVTEPLDDVDIDVAIARAEVPDITVYNMYLPRDGIMRLVSGRGQVESRFHLSGDRAQGHVHVQAPSVAAVINGIELGFDVDLELELSGGSGRARRFRLDGSALRVHNLVYPDGRTLADWSTLFRFERGELHWTAPVALDASVRLDMTSSGPLVELLAGRYAAIKWIDDALSVRNVQGSGKVAVTADALVLNDLDIVGENLQIAAKLRIDPQGARGIVFNRLGVLRATVEFVGGERDWHIISARERYDRHPGY